MLHVHIALQVIKIRRRTQCRIKPSGGPMPES